jgi:hypothetical protein
MSLRVLYRDIMFDPAHLVAAIQGLLDARKSFRSLVT